MIYSYTFQMLIHKTGIKLLLVISLIILTVITQKNNTSTNTTTQKTPTTKTPNATTPKTTVPPSATTPNATTSKTTVPPSATTQKTPTTTVPPNTTTPKTTTTTVPPNATNPKTTAPPNTTTPKTATSNITTTTTTVASNATTPKTTAKPNTNTTTNGAPIYNGTNKKNTMDDIPPRPPKIPTSPYYYSINKGKDCHSRIGTNFIKNGFFSCFVNFDNEWWSNANIFQSWNSINTQLARAIIFNENFGKQNVLLLGQNPSLSQQEIDAQISQNVVLNQGIYILQVQYSALSGYKNKSSITIYWNSFSIQARALTQQIHRIVVDVKGLNGNNILKIRTKGIVGMVISYVKLELNKNIKSIPTNTTVKITKQKSRYISNQFDNSW